MSEPGWSEVIAEHHVEESAVERSARLARQAAEAQDRADVQAEAERAADAADERDRRLMTYRQLGIGGRSLADLTADASRAAEEDDQYAEALRTIERIEKRRAARREAARAQGEQIAAASRAQIPADPLEAAQRRAHEAFRAATRAQINQAFSGQPVTRPKELSRSHGGAAPPEQECVHCINQGVDAETSFLLHSDPSRNVPVTTAEQAEQAGRSRHRSSGPMIYRTR